MCQSSKDQFHFLNLTYRVIIVSRTVGHIVLNHSELVSTHLENQYSLNMAQNKLRFVFTHQGLVSNKSLSLHAVHIRSANRKYIYRFTQALLTPLMPLADIPVGADFKTRRRERQG